MTSKSQQPKNDDSYSIECGEDPSTLLVVFGGIVGGIGLSIPPLEFVRTTSLLRFNRIFVRDMFQLWYHKGLKGYTTNLQETTRFLDAKIGALAPRKVICVGNSAGGFAAIYFGHQLRVNAVHAFAPQTYLGRFKRLLNIDIRWRKQIKQLHRLNTSNKVLNLSNILMEDNKYTNFFIHVGRHNRLDYSHAVNLKNVNRVKVLEYPCTSHLLVQLIRDTGYLHEILTLEQVEDVEKIHCAILDSINNAAKARRKAEQNLI